MNREAARKFIFHAARAHAKRSKTNDSLPPTIKKRTDLREHIEHVKMLARSGSLNRDELKEELRSIEQKMGRTVQDESLVLVKEQEASSEIDQVSEKLSRVDEKIDAYHEFEKSRDDRIEALEKKLLAKQNKNSKEINLVEKKIKALDDMYNKIKESGSVDHEKLEQIRKRMDEFKERLEKSKNGP